MIKKALKIFFLFLFFFFNVLSLEAQTNNDIFTREYTNVSSFDGTSATTSFVGSSTASVGLSFNMLLVIMAISIVTLIIFRVVQGAVIKGTFDNIYDQMNGKKLLNNAGLALLIFIFSYAILSFINPRLTGWTLATQYIKQAGGLSVGNCSPITNARFTAYSPQKGDSNGNATMEGGYLDRQDTPLYTLADYVKDKSKPVGIAGDPTISYGTKYTLSSITFVPNDGKTYVYTNVPVVLVDTGDRFKGAGTTHFDVAVDRDMSTKATDKQPFSDASGMILTPTNCSSTEDGESTSVAGQPISGDAITLAKKLLTLEQTGNVSFGLAGAKKNITNLAEGKQITTDCDKFPPEAVSISPSILGYLVALGENNKIQINTIANGCHSTDSNHYAGTAVDLQCVFNGKDLTGDSAPPKEMDAAAAANGVKRYTAENCTDEHGHHWHYSTTGH